MLTHAGTGAVFCCTWALFPDSGLLSAAAAASVVVLASAKFVLAGLGIFDDAHLVNVVGV